MKGTCRVTHSSNVWQTAPTGTIAQLPVPRSKISMLRHEKQCQNADQEWPFKHQGHTAARKRKQSFSAQTGSLLRQQPGATHCCQSMCEH